MNRANASHRATHEPSPVSRSRPTVSVTFARGRATVAPTYTWRERKPPLPFGHRTWIEGKRK
jgi:hypothetical protein